MGSEFHPADIVVSNADIAHTYRHLIDPAHRRRWTDARIDRTSFTMSCFLLYLGSKKRYPRLQHHTRILSERYRDPLQDDFRKKILPEDFGMYLHVPTRTDPGMAPEGCESKHVLVPLANNRSGIDWASIKNELAQKVLGFLEGWGMDGLRQNLEVLRLFAPDDFTSQLNACHGNAFAIEPRFTQTAWFRPHNRSQDVKGLCAVGAGTHPGAGVPGVFLSAEATFGSIAQDPGWADPWDWSEQGRVDLPDPEGSSGSGRGPGEDPQPPSGLPSWNRKESSRAG